MARNASEVLGSKPSWLTDAPVRPAWAVLSLIGFRMLPLRAWLELHALAERIDEQAAWAC